MALAQNLKQQVDTFQSFLERTNEEAPEVRAHIIFKKLKKQLKHILEEQVYSQWIFPLELMTISEDVLILKAKNDFHARWLTTQYKDLFDVLLGLQVSGMTVFFISPSDFI
jgi:hypothetical protein